VIVLNHFNAMVVSTELTLVCYFQRLLGICGSVGSGKSSLISSLLGQLRIKRGSLGIDGKLAYVPQQAWIIHDSMRENILFGTSWNERKYNRGDIYTFCGNSLLRFLIRALGTTTCFQSCFYVQDILLIALSIHQTIY